MIRPFSRLVLENGTESGLQPFQHKVTAPGGIQNYQGVDGGLYYLTGDQKLFFLKGSGGQ
jgi:hypothetical protein